MPDYTSILRRSISALPEPSPDMREAVYQRARAALARQLTAVEPPLSTREIEVQHQELEDAVARLEADFVPEEESAALAAREPREPDFDVRSERAAPSRPEPVRAAYDATPESEPDYDEGDEDLEDDAEVYDEDERSSRAPLLIGLLLLVLALGGAGAYLFTQRDSVLASFGSTDSSLTTEAPPVRVVTPQLNPDSQGAALAPEKLEDRLANGSEAPPPVEQLPPETAPLGPESLPGTLAGEEPLPDSVEPETASPPQEQQTAAVQTQPGQDLVAQRAIYYYQGKEGSPGRATEGTVTWSEVMRDNAPAIQATLRLADQDLTTTISIYRNNDGSLPASHLVEVQFSNELGASPVQRVPALVMKQTEQARGQPLTGAAVPVTNELFWIALSDDAEQVTRNLQLLREGSWFDLPILFNDGTRALLTFEKGIPGDKVFETVMASWTPT